MNNLQPTDVFRFFSEINKVPRPSGKSDKINAYLTSFANERDLEYDIDQVGNVIIRKPASPGMEEHPGVILQSHTDMVCEKINNLNFDFELFGFDISKEAVKSASGKYKKYNYAVGSCFNMPFADNSFDLALNIFAPMVENEMARILKRYGYIIYAVPGKSHLMGLKKILYEKTYENEEKHTEYDGFEFIDRISVKEKITVNGEMGVNLFKMTPYYFKTELGAEEKIQKIELKDCFKKIRGSSFRATSFILLLLRLIRPSFQGA